MIRVSCVSVKQLDQMQYGRQTLTPGFSKFTISASQYGPALKPQFVTGIRACYDSDISHFCNAITVGFYAK